MTPDERQLISDLFDRMQRFGVPVKDREAETLINQSVRSFSDAPYMLVQSTLVQEQALEQAHARIKDLEENLRVLEDKQAPASGSFLGGIFGSARAPSPSSTSGAKSDRSPWRQDTQVQQPAPPPPPASGGFLQSAMTTAAGVAGGMLAAGAIRDLLGGGAHASPAYGAGSAREEALARQDAQDDAQADLREQDARDDAEADAASPAGSDRDDAGGETEI